MSFGELPGWKDDEMDVFPRTEYHSERIAATRGRKETSNGRTHLLTYDNLDGPRTKRHPLHNDDMTTLRRSMHIFEDLDITASLPTFNSSCARAACADITFTLLVFLDHLFRLDLSSFCT